MPSKLAKDIMRQFKLHFQQAEVRIPLALRQESPDVVFHSLIENDDGPMESPGPMIGYEPMADARGFSDSFDAGIQDDSGLAGQLLEAAGSPEGGATPPGMPMGVPQGAAPPQAPQGAPQQASAPQRGPALPPDAEEILRML